MNCANCGSPDLVRLALLHERGTVNTTSSGFAYGNNVSAYVTTSSTSRTATAQRAAPPAPKNIIGWIIVWAIYVPVPALLGCGALVAALIPATQGRLGVLFLAVPMFLFSGAVHWVVSKQIKRVRRWNGDTYQRQLAEWQSQYQCNRCGVVGIPVVASATARVTNVSNPAIEG